MNEKFAIFNDRIENILEKTSAKKIVVAYSGGKDSTVLLHLCIEFARKKPIKLVILHGNTLVENPLIRDYCDKFLANLHEWSKKEKIDIETVIYTPNPDRTFWVNLIGKGYPMPHFRFRWCQKHLKIKPAEKVLKEIGGVLLVGMRIDESTDRKNSMKKRMNDMELNSNGVRVFAPIYDWKEKEIWEFLQIQSPPWGVSYSKLVNLYKEAKGECPLIPDPSFKGSGCGSRFGCWVCSVVREDRTLKNLARNNSTLSKLFSFRNWLIEFSSNVENRFPFTRKGKPAKNGKGVLTFKARKEILKRLLNLQHDIGMELIQSFEIDLIKRIWNEDEKNFSNKGLLKPLPANE